VVPEFDVDLSWHLDTCRGFIKIVEWKPFRRNQLYLLWSLSWMEMTMRWIDPPAGADYGFPKPFDPAPGQKIEDWLLANGYPQSEIDIWQGRGVPCRMWVRGEDEPSGA